MNRFNPQIHHRRSIRLNGYDYSQSGLYFITICCEDRKQQFGTVENNEMVLNEFGTVAYNEWANLPERFANFETDVFQIMPNHMHGVIALVGAGLTPAQDGLTPAPGRPQGAPQQAPRQSTISEIVGAYKSLVANECLKIWKSKWSAANPEPHDG